MRRKKAKNVSSWNARKYKQANPVTADGNGLSLLLIEYVNRIMNLENILQQMLQVDNTLIHIVRF